MSQHPKPPHTPYAKHRRSNNSSSKAPMKYAFEAATNPHASLPSLVFDVKETTDDTTWTAITQHPDVRLAFTQLGEQTTQAQKYGYVTFLLNVISLVCIDLLFPQAGDDMDVVFYDSPHLHITRGDYLGMACKPDWVAFLYPLAQLRAAVAAAKASAVARKPVLIKSAATAQGWPRLVMVGEGKPANATGIDQGQFLVYMSALKTYRPDLRTVHGLQLDDTQLRLATINACSAVESGYMQRPKEDPFYQLSGWIAHVLLVHRSVSERDTSFTHLLPEDDIVRYDIALDDQISRVVPVYTSQPPGRMTWVGFEIGGDATVLNSVCTEDCVGVVKVSYQDEKAVFSEGQMLDLAHANGWLPGVVRHTFWKRDKEAKVVNLLEPDEDEGGVRVRFKETIRLGSVGDPLSQCTTPLQMLKVAYDAIETHLQLLNRRVLHRDLSWFNIFCNPWHDPRTLKTKPVVTGIPCIEYILGEDDASKEPCCLIGDFDHAGGYPQIHDPNYQGRNGRTGTAMFSAIEMSTDRPIPRRVNAVWISALADTLRAVEDLPVFRRAFPNDTGDFVTMFEEVATLEFRRETNLEKKPRLPHDAEIRYTDPDTIVHDPCYDVQSIYWSLLWFFVRSLPEARRRTPVDTFNGAFSTFATNMLKHTIGEDGYRSNFLIQFSGPENIIHPDLVHFTEFFKDLATYLSIPWHMYKNHPKVKVPDDHAHTAVRRLLLAKIYDLTKENKQHNIALDPTQPRIINDASTSVTDLKRPPTVRDSTNPAKRKAEAAGLRQSDSDAKRQVTSATSGSATR
ncbi:hypothetical protein EXIGLDRAFT_771941 [Exidia glandulosa HHB12029]|uniref:Fungal-type protein kinase domain-containing protein n=1 Tax=Exidia glandulosa HHB12029 TaxID=1314781 RepID=A0A165FME8_EXIGL|nr:hypothetical protein EXIGLDRAFT_771941 [Exidia glandulosa HHB12029]